jgi:methylated-DNA-[protein]-cysteine S-methyltransferase
MKPTLVQYDAPGFGVGEVWLERGRVFYAELPRPRKVSDTLQVSDTSLAVRLTAFFEGADDDLRDVRVKLPQGFHGACARALRRIRRGEVVTYGELAALAGYPGAARAAGTFCGRCDLSPFIPTHRVVSADGIGSYGDLGVDYKRRLLALEGVEL